MFRLYVPLRKFIPILAFSTLAPILLVVAVQRYLGLEGTLANLLLLFPILGFFFGIMYPAIVKERDRNEIDWKLPPLVIHMGVLSNSGMRMEEMLRMISQEKEFGPLAKEMGRIDRLVKEWKMPLHEACKIVSGDISSKNLKGFLRRLSHSLQSGEDFEGFLNDEKNSVMKDYELLYERSVKGMDATQEFFSGMMTAASFVLVLMAVLPPLMGVTPLLGIVAGILITMILEALIVVIVSATLPKDDLWSKSRNRMLGQLDYYFLISVTGCAALMSAVTYIFIYGVLPASPFLMVPAALSPLLLVGLKVHKEEKLIKKKEDDYPSFVRSACSSYAYRRGSDAQVIKQLKRHDFGKLTEDIRALHLRLKMGINAKRSWNLFSSDTGSSLISRFTKIMYSGIRSGSDPSKFGETISSTFVRMNGIRKMRYSTSTVFTGLVYGLGAAVIAVIAISFAIEEYLGGIYDIEGVGEAMGLIGLPTIQPLGTQMIEGLTLLVVISYAIAGAMSIRISSSSHPYIFFLHFPLIVWLGSLVAIVMIKGVNLLMGM